MPSTRIDEYETLFKTLKHPFDVLVFTETWLTPDTENQCKISGFNHLDLLRPISEDIDLIKDVDKIRFLQCLYHINIYD